ncbi:DUF2628 domain-containing protein [Pannonibacter sp. Pt2]|uniref:DUF2628 domain-containing protein n=1 Tax=Pannonibacter anstelovis TaxID=3121537 RepID=A0ABU7ZKW5_9HYPH
MSTYMVMLPPEAEGRSLTPAMAQRAVFVRDGFSTPALVFTGIWMLVHRLWLPFLAYLTLSLVLELIAQNFIQSAPGVVAFLTGVLIGLESGNLRRWSLERKGWIFAGVVTGQDREEAELRFFNAYRPAQRPVETPAAPQPQGFVPRFGREQVIGLTLSGSGFAGSGFTGESAR